MNGEWVDRNKGGKGGGGAIAIKWKGRIPTSRLQPSGIPGPPVYLEARAWINLYAVIRYRTRGIMGIMGVSRW